MLPMAAGVHAAIAVVPATQNSITANTGSHSIE